MKNVTEYLTKFKGFSNFAFRYEVTVANQVVASLDCAWREHCPKQGHRAELIGLYVHADHQDAGLESLLRTLCQGRANNLGWSLQSIAGT